MFYYFFTHGEEIAQPVPNEVRNLVLRTALLTITGIIFALFKNTTPPTLLGKELDSLLFPSHTPFGTLKGQEYHSRGLMIDIIV